MNTERNQTLDLGNCILEISRASKKKSANIDPNRGLVLQIGGVALGVASILISILR